jgi:phage tail protein X
LQELGERLYEKITKVVIPEWEAAFKQLSLQDCIDYIFNLTINRTFDGFIREKSVVNDGLSKIFPEITQAILITLPKSAITPLVFK